MLTLRLAIVAALTVAIVGCSASTPPVSVTVTETVTELPDSPRGDDQYEEPVSNEEQLAYEDCLLGAEIAWLNFGGNEDNYWMMFEQTWAVSDPPMYPKNDATYYACMQAYDDYLATQ